MEQARNHRGEIEVLAALQLIEGKFGDAVSLDTLLKIGADLADIKPLIDDWLIVAAYPLPAGKWTPWDDPRGRTFEPKQFTGKRRRRPWLSLTPDGRKVMEIHDEQCRRKQKRAKMLAWVERQRERRLVGLFLNATRSQPGSTAAAALKKGPRHRETCPHCGKPGLEWLSIHAFHKRCKSEGLEVHGRPKLTKLRDQHDLWSDPLGEKLPWCPSCKNITPMGDGVVDRPASPEATGYTLSDADKANAQAWALNATRAVMTREDGEEEAQDFDPTNIGKLGHAESDWDEAYLEAFEAIAEETKAKCGSIYRDGAVKVGETAIKNLRQANGESKKRGDPAILPALDEHGHLLSEHRSKNQAAYRKERYRAKDGKAQR